MFRALQPRSNARGFIQVPMYQLSGCSGCEEKHGVSDSGGALPTLLKCAISCRKTPLIAWLHAAKLWLSCCACILLASRTVYDKDTLNVIS
jgi:hypothetical protein